MKIAIRQLQGNSGIDVWAENLFQGILREGHDCSLDLHHGVYQFFPFLLKFQKNPCDVEIVQSNTWNGFIFKDNSPLVATEHLMVHDPEYNQYRSVPQKIYHEWIYKCERRTLQIADSVICVSKNTQETLEKVFGYSDTQIIYNGIDTTVFKPIVQGTDIWNIPTDKTVLFFSGNLSRRKGADLLPFIMKELGEKYVLLIATGQHKTSFSSLKNIINIGQLDISHLVSAYNRCNIFVSASRLEGFGLSIAEAMSCGKPVVGTNSSAIPELVVNGKGGFLCEKDNVWDFAEKIRYISNSSDEQERMGRFNRDRVEELFTREMMVNKYLDLYRKLG